MNSMIRTILKAAFGAAALVSIPAAAIDLDYLRQLAPVAEKQIKPYGDGMFGDKVSLYDGSLQFEHTDIDLKGNNELPVRLTRQVAVGKATSTYSFNHELGNWEWVLPRIGGSFATAKGWTGVVRGNGTRNLARCSGYWLPEQVTVGGAVLEPTDYWHGTHLEVPGAGRQELLMRNASYQDAPLSGGPYPIVTKQQWQVGCLAATKNSSGEGFFAISPSGVRYDFDWMVLRTLDAVKAGGYNVPRQDMYLYATRVTDRFGNWVAYTYDANTPGLLKKIESSDGRTVTIAHASGRVSSASDGSRTYSYSYTNVANGTADSRGASLSVVTLPDGRQWNIQLAAMHPPSMASKIVSDESCADGSSYLKPDVYVGSITHPSGAMATYTAKYFLLAYDEVDTVCRVSDGIGRWSVPPSRALIGLSAKEITGPGLATQRWTFDYGVAGTTPCTAGCSTTRVVNPDNTVTLQVFGNRYHDDAGQLRYVLNGWDGSNALQTTAYSYRKGGAGQAFPELFGNSLVQELDWLAPVNAPLESTTITRDAANFSSIANSYDANARPTTVTKSGTGGSRTEATTYHDDAAVWVRNQVKDVTSGGLTVESTDYDGLARPVAHRAFGILQSTQTYNADGTIASKSDAAGHTTTYGNYMRGVAQNVSYPNGAAESGVVNNLGLLTSYTDAAGYTTAYGYDPMGRLASITPPSGYTGTTVVFEPVDSPEFDLPPGHWRQTVSKGNARTVTYFDAMWRPVMSRTFDASNEGATRKVVVKAYDVQNRVTFESHPQRDVASVAVTSPGTRTSYDAIGRPTRVEADSELGPLATTTEYLPGLQTRTTNPRGHATTRTMWALDKPDESSISAISAPEGVQVAIVRDAFGKPTRISRAGVTRSYVYDGGQRLCKTVEPEAGATVQDYDAVGNVAWRAPGQALRSLRSCDTGSVPAAGKISFSYDEIGQLLSTSYGDGSPGVVRSYWPDARLKTIESDGSTWSYSYNALRALETETLNFGGQTYLLIHGYNAAGDPASLQYPNGATVGYSPNALGEPTAAGGYATGVSFHPNGALAGYTLGNGIARTTTQNTRGLPLVDRAAGVMQDEYSYDANGNVAAIADRQEGVFNRTMGYDALDRLTSAAAPGVWRSASYTYDAVDNLTSATVGGRSSTMAYDANNRLSSVVTNGVLTNYGYDALGNIRSKGGQSYTFDLGNRLVASNLGGGYQYDGHGRRTRMVENDGSTRLQAYGQGGQLLWAVAQDVVSPVPATVTGYTCAAGTLSGSQCTSTSSYAAMPNGYTCNAGDTLGGSTCTHTETSTYAAGVTAYACAAGDTLSGTTCTHTETSTYGASVASYSCAAGDTLGGATCTHTTTSTYAAGVTGYSCAAGDTLDGSTCWRTTVTSTYAATPVYACNAGDALAGTTCSHTSVVAATPVYGCPAGYTLGGTTCSLTTSVAATPTAYSCNGLGSPALSGDIYVCTGTTYPSTDESDAVKCDLAFVNYGLEFLVSKRSGSRLVCTFRAQVTYSCPGGGTLSDAQCVSTTQQQATVSGYSCSSGTVSGSSCLVTSSYGASVASYTCAAGDALNGATCSHSTTTTYAATPAYGCNAGDALAGTTCSHNSASTYGATPAYVCNAGDALGGSTCTHVSTGTYAATIGSYACNAGDTLAGSTCTHVATSTYDATVSGYACNAGDTLGGSTCTHTSVTAATPTYSCTSGTLSGSNCVGNRTQTTTAYVYLAGKQIAETANGVTQYVHTDALGSPVAHSNAGAVVMNRTRFEPYGYPAQGTKPGKATSVIGFTGHVQDAETELVYMQQRYYDPVAGRFLSVDPIVTDANTGKGFGLYTYVDNNPYAKVDPDGSCEVPTGSHICVSDATPKIAEIPTGSVGSYSAPPAQAVGGGLLAKLAEATEPLAGFPQLAIVPGTLKLASIATKSDKIIDVAASATKAINLPGWRKLAVDIEHIAERHMAGGALSEGKSVFVGLNERGIMAAIQQAYGSATKIAVQGERVLLSGMTKTGIAVEMWLNKATNVIETAYPVVEK